MPNVWCHILLAEDSARSLPTISEQLLAGGQAALFRLAAQGPDFFLYDNWQRAYLGSRYQTGRFLHRQDCRNALLFAVSEIAGRQDENLSDLAVYTLGAAAHFVADATIHPLVYRLIEQLGGGNNRHSQLEAAMDSFLLQEVYGSSEPLLKNAQTLTCSPEQEAAVAQYYCRLCNQYFQGALPPLKPAQVRRALGSYWLAQTATHHHGRGYKLCRALAAFSGRRLRLDYLWRPAVVSAELAELLRQNAFLDCFEQAGNLGRAVFAAIWDYWQGRSDLARLQKLLPNVSYLGEAQAEQTAAL